jgi:hypothetical protein
MIENTYGRFLSLRTLHPLRSSALSQITAICEDFSGRFRQIDAPVPSPYYPHFLTASERMLAP